MLAIIPNWHPIFVNFTVALFIVSAVLYVVVLLAPNAAWRRGCLTAARWNLLLGAGFALITVGTGLQAYYSVAHDSPSHAAMTDHRNWAFVTAAVIVALGLRQWLRRHRDTAPNALLAVILVLAGGLLTVTAWKGAELVFRYGLGVMALVESEGPGHSHEHGSDDHGSADAVPVQEENDSSHAGHEHGSADAAPAKEGGNGSHAHHDHGGSPDCVPADGPTCAIVSFHAALSGGDEQTVVAALAPDVLIFESGGAERSRAEYQSHHMKSDMAFLKQMQSDVITRDESVRGDTAWVVTESRIRGRYKDSDIDLMSIETAVLERTEDGWKIGHLHWSSREQ